MIKATELRIGNKVIALKNSGYDSRGVITAQSIGSRGVNNWEDMGASGELAFSDLNPIPLTPEILEKCGFANSEYYRHNHAINAGGCWYSVHYQDDTDEYWRGWIFNNDESDAACHRVAKIEFVHQLQNLFFALTGEELNVQL